MSGLMKNSYCDNPGPDVYPRRDLVEDGRNGRVGPATTEIPSYPIPVFSGLLRDGHCQRMGAAIWLFIWLLDKVTSEYTDEEGTRWGRVLRGQPIQYQNIIDDLGISERTAKRYLVTLRKENYVRVERRPYGLILEIRNSRKWTFRQAKNGLSRSDKSGLSEAEGPNVAYPDRPDLSSRQAKSGTGNSFELSQQRVSRKDNTRHNKKIYVPDSKPLGLAVLLRDLILERRPNYRWGIREKPDLQEWARQIDLMHRNDGRDFGQIERVIKWCQEDGFWAKNICSVDKLRKQFTRLEDQMEDPKSLAGKTDSPKYVVVGD